MRSYTLCAPRTRSFTEQVAEPQAAVHGFSARRLGVAQNDVYAVGCLAAGEKLKGECLGHLAYDDAPLVKPIVACEHLAAGNALGFRLIGLYIGYGDALTPVGVIYEQLRVNAEGLVQHVFTGVGERTREGLSWSVCQGLRALRMCRGLHARNPLSGGDPTASRGSSSRQARR